MSSILKFDYDPVNRRSTHCRELRIFGVPIVFSYNTPIAFGGPDGWRRQKNHWGPTTGRHFKQAVPDGARMIDDEEEFVRELDAAIMKQILTDKETIAKLVPAAVAAKLSKEPEDVLG